LLERHLVAFAAEEARLNGHVVDMQAYRTRVEGESLNDSLKQNQIREPLHVLHHLDESYAADMDLKVLQVQLNNA